MIIAVTGYIGTGKSTVAKRLVSHGFSLIDADSIGHSLLDHKEIKDKLIGAFGLDILGRDLSIDREKLREIAFSDPVRIQELDRIVHPLLIKGIRDAIRQQPGDSVIDVALYKELGIDTLADKTLLITSDIGRVYDRLRRRYSKSQVLAIMNSQHVITTADHTIENNSTITELCSAVDSYLSTIR